jgi:alanyl-tRNA synthetase
MTTERLYYVDSYCTEFEAIVTDCLRIEGRTSILLDQSYFYPTSGGQPFDTGYLDAAQVVDVLMGADGELHHLLAGEAPDLHPGQHIHGRIDWPRRYDHMQQHSGQHLLSQVFYRLFGFETISVHFGASESTLDLDAPTIEPEQLHKAERYANQLVYRTLPIRAYFVGDAQLPSVPLRRPPKVTGAIRIVEIDQFDYSACGGTHVRTTAEIGPIFLIKAERRRGQTRLTFLCGQRSLEDYGRKHQLLGQIASLYSTDIHETPALVARDLAQIKELQRTVDLLQTQLLVYEAAALVQTATPSGAYRIIVQWAAEREINVVKTLANQLQQHPGVVALLGTNRGGKLTVFFARSPDVALHMGNLLRDTLAQFGGKGGGRPDFAQGGMGNTAVGQELLQAALHQLQSDNDKTEG